MEFFTGSQAPVYRGVTLEDLTRIEAIELAEFGPLAYPYFALRQLFDLHGADWVIAEIGQDAVGYIMVGVVPDGRAWIMGFAVGSDARGHGYGRELLEHGLRRCQAALVQRVFITVRPTNHAAYNLYKSVGFIRADHEEEYFGDGEPRDILVCAFE